MNTDINITGVYLETESLFLRPFKETDLLDVNEYVQVPDAGEKYRFLKCREIGYVLSKEYWGKGFMVQAVSKVLNFCFKDLQLDAIFCGYYKRNHQSKRVAEKIGFHYVCDQTLKTKYDTEEKSILTVIHKNDWVR